MQSGIYKITNPEGKIYIGKSKNINTRFNHYKSLNCKNQPEIFYSLKKYGWFHHSFEIIEKCKISFLLQRAQYWVNYYNSIREGLNSDGKNRGPKDGYILNRTFSKEILESKSKKMKKLWKSGKFKRNNSKPVKNNQAGEIYNSRNECVKILNLSSGAFTKLLKEGKISYIIRK